jgi:hypothetical protein
MESYPREQPSTRSPTQIKYDDSRLLQELELGTGM